MVFCKAPLAGQVKTRLTPPLTSEEAVRLHCELTRKTFQIATQFHLCKVELWCAPSTDHPFFDEIANAFNVEKCLQEGASLGERMHAAFVSALKKYRSAVIIGCDCPSLTPDLIEQSLSCLTNGKECVLAPAEDGGYVLIGLYRPHATLFTDIPWGSGQVCELTRDRLRMLGVDYEETAVQWDVDNINDLNRYRLQNSTEKSQ